MGLMWGDVGCGFGGCEPISSGNFYGSCRRPEWDPVGGDQIWISTGGQPEKGSAEEQEIDAFFANSSCSFSKYGKPLL